MQFRLENERDDPAYAAWAAENLDPLPLRPEIPSYLEFYIDSWRLLSDDRYVDGLGAVGPIPYLVMRAYAQEAGISGQEFQYFLKMMKAMDSEYLSWVAENRPKAKAENNGS